MKSATKAVIAGVAGIALLAGGAGSLAFWTDTKPGTSVVINSGDLSLGTITDGTGWMLSQAAGDLPAGTTATTPVAYTSQLIVPGDVLTKTVNIPVTLTGTNNKATLAVTKAVTGSGSDLVATLQPSIVSVNGVNGATSATLTPTQVTALSGVVPVVYSITFPWTTSTGAIAKAQQASFQASYTLTQVPATTP
jgi:alternate signal-mediated exported protein